MLMSGTRAATVTRMTIGCHVKTEFCLPVQTNTASYCSLECVRAVITGKPVMSFRITFLDLCLNLTSSFFIPLFVFLFDGGGRG